MSVIQLAKDTADKVLLDRDKAELIVDLMSPREQWFLHWELVCRILEAVPAGLDDDAQRYSNFIKDRGWTPRPSDEPPLK